jgi:uncharacterized membrane protein
VNDGRRVRQTLRYAGGVNWSTYWYDYDVAVADMKGTIAANPNVRWGYVCIPGTTLLHRERRPRVAVR